MPLLEPLKNVLSAIEPRNPDYFIISDDGKTPLTNRRYITLFNQYKIATGVDCTAHRLRHSFASIGFENELSPKTMQELLGHKQLSTTMDIYTDFRKKALLAAAKELNDAFSEEKKN